MSHPSGKGFPILTESHHLPPEPVHTQPLPAFNSQVTQPNTSFYPFYASPPWVKFPQMHLVTVASSSTQASPWSPQWVDPSGVERQWDLHRDQRKS